MRKHESHAVAIFLFIQYVTEFNFRLRSVAESIV